MRRALSCVFALLLCVAAYPPVANAAPDPLCALQEKTASLVSLAADFTQETRIPLFDAPVVSTGRMVFERPDAVRWEYSSPMREGFAIKGAKGIRWRDGAKHNESFNVASDPVGALVARQLLTWVTLDLDAIRKEYDISVTETDNIALRLRPKRAEVAEILKELTIDFAPNGAASKVAIAETRGGVTTIRFANVRINVSVAAGEFP